MDDVSVVVAVLATVLIVLALVFYVVTLVWAGRNRLVGSPSPSGSSGSNAPPRQTDSLARGFSYLHVLPHDGGRQPDVQQRLARAFVRIDAVDPHAAPRRIGEALLQAGLALPPSAAPSSPAAQPRGPWTVSTANRPEELE